MPITIKKSGMYIKNGGKYSAIDFLEGENIEYNTGEYITPEMYGAVGDGVADDTESVQNAVNSAVSSGGIVYLSAKHTYLVSTVILSQGIKGFIGDGILKGKGGETAILNLGGGTYSLHPANDCSIKANIDMSNGNMYGIRGIGIQNCTINGCKIYGFTDSSTTSRIGISLESASNNNKICENTIIGYEQPDHTMSHIGIRIVSESGAVWAGFYNNGEIVDSPAPSSHNIIDSNYIAFGEVAIDLLGNKGTIITNNTCYKNATRAIYCADAEHQSVIENNCIIGFSASAILFGYGCHNNIISGNNIQQISGYNTYGGEAAINVICGCYENSIIGNAIETMTNYGIYLAVNSIENVVDGNTISGYYIAAIALESDWCRPLPSEALYSRPNYGEPAIGDKWASKDSYGNVIQNNVIKEGYPERMPCSIYVAQIGTNAKINYNTIQNNSIVHPQLASSWSIRFVEETDGYMVNNNLINNTVRDVNVNRQFLSRGKSHFDKCYGNDGIDTATVTLSSGSTPSVGKGKYFICGYSSATNITDFLESMDGQEIIVNLNANTTIVQNGAKIQLKNATNVTGTSGLSLITFVRFYNVWYEKSRNF